MDLARIVSDLKKERDRLDRAITALEGKGFAVKLGRSQTFRKRRLSAAGRKRISEAMKKRWAARRRGNSKGIAKAA